MIGFQRELHVLVNSLRKNQVRIKKSGPLAQVTLRVWYAIMLQHCKSGIEKVVARDFTPFAFNNRLVKRFPREVARCRATNSARLQHMDGLSPLNTEFPSPVLPSFPQSKLFTSK